MKKPFFDVKSEDSVTVVDTNEIIHSIDALHIDLEGSTLSSTVCSNTVIAALSAASAAQSVTLLSSWAIFNTSDITGVGAREGARVDKGRAVGKTLGRCDGAVVSATVGNMVVS